MSMERAEALLQKLFGHSGFRAGQREVVEALLAGQSSLAIFPTGGGKSLCYQLPALLMPGLTLVISPLIALMKDQVEQLKSKGIAAERLDSTLTALESQSVIQRMVSGELKLLYIAPERLLNERFLRRLEKTKISMLAVDEAHCISEWGHNFRPEYLRLAKVAQDLKISPILALTATATPKVAEQICEGFQIKDAQRFQTSFHRPNLFLQVSAQQDRLNYLEQQLSSAERLPAIVYVTLQSTAESVSTYLQKKGHASRAYHAGLPSDFRSETQEAFLKGDIDIIVATIAFGMGIDKSNVRSVYHYNLPKTLENYQQEIGRAGRDGQPSHCEVIAHLDDRRLLQNFIYGDTPSPLAIQGVIEYLLRQGQYPEISHYETSRAFDIKPAVLETLLTYLELRDLFRPLGSYYAKFQWAYERHEASALSGLSAEFRHQLEPILKHTKRGYKWMTLDLREVREEIGLKPTQVAAILNEWTSSGELQLKPSIIMHVFESKMKEQSVAIPKLVQELQQRFEQKETQELGRIDSVIEFLREPLCLTHRLIEYFGESTSGSCGHCDVCVGIVDLTGPRALPESDLPELTVDDWKTIQNLKAANLPALRHARAFTRFLCGISSPAFTRDKLQQHEAFASFEHHAFQDIFAQIKTLTW